VTRQLSFTEIQTALTCEGRHAFQYTGRLTGGETLKRKQIAVELSNGRAWGAAVAAWHGFPADTSLLDAYRPVLAKQAAHEALLASYRHDVEEQLAAGVWVPVEAQVDRQTWLAEILDHYMATGVPLENLTRIEGGFDMPLPSRTGKRVSTVYRFTGFLDGWTVPAGGGHALVEFKFRSRLTPPDQVQLSRQVRWYALALQRETGVPVIGAVLDERLAEPPKPPRVVQAKRKGEGVDGWTVSHAKDQLTTPELYLEACGLFDAEPEPDTLDALRTRLWQQRHPILFRPSELAEAERELVSAAKLIRDLDSGARYPVRNAQTQLCRRCRYLEACPNPDDQFYLDTLYERTVPKRLRAREEESTGGGTLAPGPPAGLFAEAA
jgi:hypothetical protein